MIITYDKENLLPVIVKAVENKKPLSIVRYGDGEAMILNGFNDLEKFKAVLKRQLGYLPPLEDMEAIRANLISSYKDADIIGIPTANRFMDNKNSYWYKAFDILSESIGIEVLHTKRFTDIDFHSHFLEKGFFNDLITNLDTLCYISCRNLDDEFKKAFGIKNVFSFIVAPEMKFTSGYTGEKHFPDQYNKIHRWVTKVPVEGSICLVGAGVVGKMYCNWLRDLGGIAIDIGSVFDQWAGKLTRGSDRGLDAVDNTYKL